MVRVFIAIDVPPSVRDQLQRMQEHLGDVQLPVRWVQPDGIHLTLAFLGDVLEAHLPAIQQVMDRVSERHVPFRLAVAGLGAFPVRGTPRVIWAGVDGDLAPLSHLHQQLTAELRSSGFAIEDRSFSPHVTLGRAKSPWSAAHLQAWRSTVTRVPSEFGRWTVKCISLMQSHFQPQGSRYTERYTCELRQQTLPLA